MLNKNNQMTSVALRSVMFCNTGDFLAQMAKIGAGITVKSAWSVTEEMENGQLIRVLPDYQVESPRQVYALVPRREYTPDRVTYVLNCITRFISDKHKC